jgi:hypothetical protein
MDENNAAADEIVEQVEKITANLIQFTVPAPSTAPPDVAARINKFNSYVYPRSMHEYKLRHKPQTAR